VLRTVVNARSSRASCRQAFYFHNEGDGFVDHAILNRKVGASATTATAPRSVHAERVSTRC
jgi:hypothetical protein